MNIYRISQKVNVGYDTFDSAIVIAINEQEARKIHPASYITHWKDYGWYGSLSDGEEYKNCDGNHNWVDANQLDKVSVELLGVADSKYKESCAILSSYNRG